MEINQSGPIANPILSPVGQSAPPQQTFGEVITPAANTLQTVGNALNTAIVQHLTAAQSALTQVNGALHGMVTSNLQVAQGVIDDVTNTLEASVAGHLGSALQIGLGVPGFEPPNMADIASNLSVVPTQIVSKPPLAPVPNPPSVPYAQQLTGSSSALQSLTLGTQHSIPSPGNPTGVLQSNLQCIIPWEFGVKPCAIPPNPVPNLEWFTHTPSAAPDGCPGWGEVLEDAPEGAGPRCVGGPFAGQYIPVWIGGTAQIVWLYPENNLLTMNFSDYPQGTFKFGIPTNWEGKGVVQGPWVYPGSSIVVKPPPKLPPQPPICPPQIVCPPEKICPPCEPCLPPNPPICPPCEPTICPPCGPTHPPCSPGDPTCGQPPPSNGVCPPPVVCPPQTIIVQPGPVDPGQPTDPPIQVDPGTNIKNILWPDWCDVFGITNVQKAIDLLQQASGQDLWGVLNAIKPEGGINTDSTAGQILNSMPSPLQGVAIAAINVANMLMKWIAANGASKVGIMSIPFLVKLVIGFINKWGGFDIKSALVHADYILDAASPDLIPGSSQFNTLRLTDQVNYDQWRIGVSANNDCPSWQELVVQSQRMRPDYFQAIKLSRLGEWNGGLTNEDLRSYAFTNDIDSARMDLATRLWPGIQEVFDWIQRSVFDDNLAEQQNSDSEIQNLNKGVTSNYTEGTGTIGELKTYRWRAHWRLPDPMQAYEMGWRFRAGRVPDKLVTPQKDIDSIQQAHAIHPYWRARLQAVARPFLDRRTIMRIYANTPISDNDAVQAIMDSGFTEDIAKQQVAALRALKLTKLSKVSQAKQYIEGGVGVDDLRAALIADGATNDQAQSVIDSTIAELNATTQASRVKALRQRFMLGDLSSNDATNLLVKIGLDLAQANTLVQEWTYDREVHGRENQATQLVDWYESNLIDAVTLASRLVQIGYIPDDAAKIISLANSKMAATLAREQQKQQTTEQRQQQSAKRAMLQAQKAKIAAAKAAEKVAISLNESAQKLSSKLGTPADQAVQQITAFYETYLNLTKGSPQGAAAVVKQAAELATGKNPVDWDTITQSILNAIAEEQKTIGGSL